MTDPITKLVLAKVIDAAFTAFSTGMRREDVLAEVDAWERAGRTPDEIADLLAHGRRDSSDEARRA